MSERSDRYACGRRLLLGTAMLLGMLLSNAGGCTRSVVILHPPGEFTGTVQTFTVKFHPDFKPGTFDANLSGQNITGLFKPTPAPGIESSASFTFPPNFMDRQFNNNRQKLAVFGDFATPTSGLGNRIKADSVEFSPPYTAVYSDRTGFNKELKVKEGETITAFAFVQDAPKEALTVTITGNDRVSLNDQTAGASIQVIIPTNDRRAAFTVRGIQAGGGFFQFRAIATGFASDVSVCQVLSPP
jgi:hypothetical protein